MQTTGWRDGLGTHVGVSMITGEVNITVSCRFPLLDIALVSCSMKGAVKSASLGMSLQLALTAHHCDHRPCCDHNHRSCGCCQDAHVLWRQQICRPARLRGRHCQAGGPAWLLQGMDRQLCPPRASDDAHVCVHGAHAPAERHEGLVVNMQLRDWIFVAQPCDGAEERLPAACLRSAPS